MVKIILILFSFFLSSCLWESPNFQELDYLPLDDSEYPYAFIPRILIETEDFKEINDKETYHKAFFQIYGKTAPLTEIQNLEIRGRGHSSFAFPKFSYRLKFKEKISLFNMPENKDWVLLSNYSDKTLLKNKLSFALAKKLKAPYSPQSEFVELYINREYLGLYQLTEKIEVAKSKVRLPESENSFLVEIDNKHSKEDPVVFSSKFNLPLHIHYPKNPSENSQDTLSKFINEFEQFLTESKTLSLEELSHWIDIDSYLRYYWLQEFSLNNDAFANSTYFTWFPKSHIQMGPIWDMDIAYGGAHIIKPEGWQVKNLFWNKPLFSDSTFNTLSKKYWESHKAEFLAMVDSVNLWSKNLEQAAKNNFKRWPILESTDSWAHNFSASSYKEANETLKAWLKARYLWIEENLNRN